MNVENILGKLKNKEDLDNSESKEVMKLIIEGNLSDEQIGEILIALQDKGVSVTELSAFVEIIKTFAVRINPDVELLVDTCGTGGDKSSTFNVSTVTAFVLAGCGVAVAKHGNRSVSSECGSADVLEKLGINIELSPENTEKCIEKIGIGFMFAPLYHPAFKNVAPIRKKLGVRTVFNILGPLLNPASPKAQVIGVYDPALTELFAQTLEKSGMKNAMIVHGNGLDEITLCGETKITQLKDGNIKTFNLNPAKLGFKECAENDLKGKGVEENAKIFLGILNGDKSAKRDVVLLNAAAGLIVAEKAENFEDGIKMAAEAIDNDNALKKFEELKRMSNDLAKNS
jgi:anthranilate phosphoribosyltransferase